MSEKKWTFVIVDSADAVTELLNKKEFDPQYAHIVLASHDKFYVFYLD